MLTCVLLFDIIVRMNLERESMTITYQYINHRIAQLVRHFEGVLTTLNYEQDDIDKQVKQLSTRLQSGTGKLYGTTLGAHLTRIKRITRNFIRSAIMHSPQRQSYIKRLKAQYNARYEQMRQDNPFANAFSFEHAYCKQLRIRFADHQSLFKLSPKADLATAINKAVQTA